MCSFDIKCEMQLIFCVDWRLFLSRCLLALVSQFSFNRDAGKQESRCFVVTGSKVQFLCRKPAEVSLLVDGKLIPLIVKSSECCIMVM